MILKTEKRDRLIGLVEQLKEIDRESGKNRISDKEYGELDFLLRTTPDNGKIKFTKWVALHVLEWCANRIILLEGKKKGSSYPKK